jgi:hypothetical protein
MCFLLFRHSVIHLLANFVETAFSPTTYKSFPAHKFSSFGFVFSDAWAIVVGPLSVVSTLMEFIFPPSNTIALDFSNALTYTIGQRLTVYWTKSPSGVAASLLLWQANRETGVLVGTQEYVLRM